MGGPVIIPHLYNGRNKTFFFFSWEQYRQQQGGVNPSTVPTAKERTGDFNEILTSTLATNTPNPCDQTPIFQGEIFDPNNPANQPGVCQIAFLNEPGNIGNNAIPGGLSPVGQKILSYYPAPQNGALVNNYNFPYSFPIEDTTMTFRIDQNIF